tara:strand:+ start:2874 stop:3131 length:258 start_codon:yes stop_codon:yes gene_type:complete
MTSPLHRELIQKKMRKPLIVYTLERKLQSKDQIIQRLEEEIESLYLENQLLRTRLKGTKTIAIEKTRAVNTEEGITGSPQFKLSL